MPSTPHQPQIVPIKGLSLFWQLQLAGWSVFAIVSLPLKLAGFGSLAPAVWVTALQLPLSLLLSTALRYFYRWAQPARRPFLQAAGLVWVASAAACFIDASVSFPITRLFAVSPPAEQLETALYFFRAAVYLIWSLGYILIKTQLRSRDLAFQAAVDEERHRFELLRYQLNPNFLSKSLATISHQIEVNPATARAMTVQLSSFYQNTLRQTDRGQTATIGAELALLRAYLDIEQLRRRDALQVRFDVDDTLLSLPLPPVLLLPLAERAVQSGDGTPGQPLEIQVTVRREADGQVLLEVSHSGRLDRSSPPFSDTAESGVAEVRANLARHFAGRHRFTLSQDSLMVRATISLPLTT
jgi:hypothetical protein